MKDTNRRDFLHRTTLASLGLVAACGRAEEQAETQPARGEPVFKISLAQWSLHRSIFGGDPGETVGWENFEKALHGSDYPSLLAGSVDPLDFARIAREDFDINGIEYVNTFYFDRTRDKGYLAQLKKRAEDYGVQSLLIMCDGEGDLGNPDEADRIQAVANHHRWVETAAFLGCHSIRVNARSDESLSREEQQKRAADGLRRLCEFADPHGINILVENHGGLSSDGSWLAGVMKLVDHPRVGTLPDFGNFEISEGNVYDRYQGVQELMPFAKSVSAKSQEFDEQGNETQTDFKRMTKIVLDAGFRGWVGIEYEGARLSEPEGIRATKALLERVRSELASDYV